jgi:exopolyphosphatase/guanosine-5'-triphosphate,3'-diphosphate pyrophosphatase
MTRVAAIDCGTNSIRLLVADVPARPDATAPLTDVLRRMEIVRLGQGVDRTGRLAAEAIERTRVVLADYTDQLRRLGAERVRMVATSASRDAGNAADFQAMVRSTLGQPSEVVSGDEEARLSFTGAVRGLAGEAPGPYLVVDIGGVSTEFVLGEGEGEAHGGDEGGVGDGSAGAGPVAALSVDIGCVRMTERHLRDDPPTAAQIAAAEADITAATDRALDAVGARGRAATLVGLAGSVTTVAALALDLPAYQPERIHRAQVGYAQVAAVTATLLAETAAQRAARPVMHPGRADVIGAGALILRIVMERAGLDAVVASEHDILDGIAWSLAGGAGRAS